MIFEVQAWISISKSSIGHWIHSNVCLKRRRLVWALKIPRDLVLVILNDILIVNRIYFNHRQIFLFSQASFIHNSRKQSYHKNNMQTYKAFCCLPSGFKQI